MPDDFEPTDEPRQIRVKVYHGDQIISSDLATVFSTEHWDRHSVGLSLSRIQGTLPFLAVSFLGELDGIWEEIQVWTHRLLSNIPLSEFHVTMNDEDTGEEIPDLRHD